jgi:two-component system LytT family sensor kinase
VHNHWPLQRRELVLIFAFWTLMATLSSVNRIVDPRGFGFRFMSPAGPVSMAFVESWIWAAVTPFVFWLASRPGLSRSPWTRIPLLLLVGVAIAIVVHTLIGFARMSFIEVPTRRNIFSPMRDLVRFRFVNQLIVYCAVLAAGFAREYFLRDRDRQREAIELSAHASRLQAQLAGARLDALRMQLNPHFLFNTLHAISALVERDPGGVRRMIARLSELLRHTIDREAPDEVPLRDELAFLRRYIEIMEIRFQGRLRVETNIDEAALDALVPNLVLQPIVENALEHGASRAGGEGRIEISARRDGERILLAVRDNGPGLKDGVESGVGLANTRARLAQLYGDAAALALSSPPGGGVLAEIELPFHTGGDLRTNGVADG